MTGTRLAGGLRVGTGRRRDVIGWTGRTSAVGRTSGSGEGTAARSPGWARDVAVDEGLAVVVASEQGALFCGGLESTVYDLDNGHRTKSPSAPASTWMPPPPRRPAVTLTFDLQNLIRSPVRASEYSL